LGPLRFPVDLRPCAAHRRKIIGRPIAPAKAFNRSGRRGQQLLGLALPFREDGRRYASRRRQEWICQLRATSSLRSAGERRIDPLRAGLAVLAVRAQACRRAKARPTSVSTVRVFSSFSFLGDISVGPDGPVFLFSARNRAALEGNSVRCGRWAFSAAKNRRAHVVCFSSKARSLAFWWAA